VRKIMPERGSFDVTAVAFHQTIERGIGRDNVLRHAQCRSAQKCCADLGAFAADNKIRVVGGIYQLRTGKVQSLS
jgi:hypothetical protein